ncbi:MAG TPA: N-acetyl-gamma-glutamyl-phosphate reductase, partial [Mycobacteriales bacterium]|nr:N-acetyl-gamma-glutamyl-phosphate reductase [Mycobacteriales bacterium]
MGVMVAVAGASGYAGGELLRLLAGHPQVQLGPLGANSSAGVRVTDVHPHLVELDDRTFVDTTPGSLAAADVVLLALPHGASAAIAAELPSSLPVIDLGADFRLTDPVLWDRYYGGTYAGSWPYGLPELPGARAALAGARRIAVPGCHATAVELALVPLLAAGLVEPEDLTAVTVTGSSGAGRTTKVEFTSAAVMGDAAAYQVGKHRHTAEIVQALA